MSSFNGAEEEIEQNTFGKECDNLIKRVESFADFCLHEARAFQGCRIPAVIF